MQHFPNATRFAQFWTATNSTCTQHFRNISVPILENQGILQNQRKGMSTKTKQNKTFATFEPNFEFQLDGVVDHRKCCIMHTTCKIVADKAINGPKFANMLPRIRKILPTLATTTSRESPCLCVLGLHYVHQSLKIICLLQLFLSRFLAAGC